MTSFHMLEVGDDEYPVSGSHGEFKYSTVAPCMLHSDHVPATHVNEIHHVWPKGMGGPDIPENRIVTCATGHNNIHKLMRIFTEMDGRVPYSITRTYSFKERYYAKLGWERSVRKFM